MTEIKQKYNWEELAEKGIDAKLVLDTIKIKFVQIYGPGVRGQVRPSQPADEFVRSGGVDTAELLDT